MDISQASPTLNHAFPWSAADLSLVNTFNALKNSSGCTFKSITSQLVMIAKTHTHTLNPAHSNTYSYSITSPLKHKTPVRPFPSMQAQIREQ